LQAGCRGLPTDALDRGAGRRVWYLCSFDEIDVEAEAPELTNGATTGSLGVFALVVVAARFPVPLVMFQHVPRSGQDVFLQRYVRALSIAEITKKSQPPITIGEHATALGYFRITIATARRGRAAPVTHIRITSFALASPRERRSPPSSDRTTG
jgi:hypothetical protein